LNCREGFESFRRLIQGRRNRTKVSTTDSGDGLFEKVTEGRAAPGAELTFRITQGVEQIYRDAPSHPVWHGTGLVAASENQKLAVIAGSRHRG
jgi:hypothetical protein